MLKNKKPVKPKMGRPPKDPSLVKSLTRSVRLTASELEWIEARGGLQEVFNAALKEYVLAASLK